MNRPAPPDAGELYRAHAEFVWRALYRFGVHESELPDALQEVFIVVHRRRETFDGTSAITTWLFGIAMRVASDFRRKARRRREDPVAPEAIPAVAVEHNPDAALADLRARKRVDGCLAAMSSEHRAVFLLYEIEGMPCERIATLMDAPLGTIYSRLHYARRAFMQALEVDDE